jgi:tetrahydromethanopterin S-methyltransferase subunit F
MFWAGLAIGFIIGMALLAILWFIFIGKINI